MAAVDFGLRSRLFELLVAERAQDVFTGLGFEFSETLDRMAELAVDLTGFEAAAICLFDRTEIKPIGGYSFPRKSYPRVSGFNPSLNAKVRPNRYYYEPDLELTHGASPVVDGTMANFRSSAYAIISIEEEPIGFLAVLSNQRNFAPESCAEHYVVELAALAKVVILSKAKLKLIMMDAFSLANK